MFLIFDTETTGLPSNYNAPVSDSSNWPRMVQIAWQLHDKFGKLLNHNSIIIKPEGYKIPFAATKIHGISNEQALLEGKDLVKSLDEFISVLNYTTYICGHNIDFDIKIIGAEFYRYGKNNFFAGKKKLDTISNQTTEFCALPGGKGGKFKYPSLTELYKKLFSEKFQEAHNASFDVQATAKVLFEIIKRKIISIAEITENEITKINYEDVDLSHLLKTESKSETRTETKAATTLNSLLTTHSFSHLHNHSQYSVLQSISDLNNLIDRAVDFKMPALALTDHGNMYATFLFWQAIDKYNKSVKIHNEKIISGEKKGEEKKLLKCIIGCELNVTRNHLDKSKHDNGFQIPFLAKNKIGYQNLCKLSSKGFTEGMYYVPRVDKDLLAQYKDGLICFTGSIHGEIPSTIINFGEEDGEKIFLWYKNLFGDDFYVELNRHSLQEEEYVNEVLLRFAKKHNVKYFAANNNYYIDKKNALSRDILLCVKEGLNFSSDKDLVELKNNSRTGKYFFPNDEFYFKSPEEMSKLFHDLPEALECTNDIISKIENYNLGREVLLPKFKIPTEYEDPRDLQTEDEGKGKRGENAYLKFLTYQGAEKKYPNLNKEIRERIDFELKVMERMGYPGYFLIVSDITSKAREIGVSVGPGRGSAAGSVVAYCLGITNVDPIKYDLLFERFLNPDRISMPDIDIDFDDEGRDKVIKYVIEKYGFNHVAQIITYSIMGGRSAIRDTARVLNLPLGEADKLAKSFPESLEADLKSLLKETGMDSSYLEKIKDRRDVVEQSKNFRKIWEGNSPEANVLKQAVELEGCVRNTGVHACGMIITPDEVTQFVPVTKAKDSEMLLTQFDNSVAESAGLLKMDFLGLRTLTIIKDAIAMIEQNLGEKIDIDNIDLNDKLSLELFQRGETSGIFQFESLGMQKYLRDLKPDNFTDLIAMNALFRPGPLAYIPNYIARKHGREKISYDLNSMEEFLQETYGITVYQEQVMRLSQKLANFSKGDADTLRKAMGKKQKDVLDKMKSKFLEGCKANNHDTTIAEKIWKDWEAFASYAFNKSHSTCYAYLAMQTAYLKSHYPSEFMASVLNHSGNIEKITFFMEECKRMGIKVLGPDVNEGFAKFSVMPDRSIRFGMAGIKGVGENVVNILVKERNENGKFKSVFDLAARLDSKSINKKTIEGFALSGAFDSFKNLHRAMFFHLDNDGTNLTDRLIKYCNQKNLGNDSNQVNMFDEDSFGIVEPDLPNVERWSEIEQLNKEKEVVGFFISGHPLDPYKIVIEYRCNVNAQQLKNGLENFKNKEVVFAGIVSSFENRTSKTGNAFGKIILEDYHDSIELMLFGKDFVEFGKFMIQGLFVFVKARVQERFNQPGSLEIKITKIELLEEVKKNSFKRINIILKVQNIDEKLINFIQELIINYEGKSQVEFLIEDETEKQNVKLFSKKNKVRIEQTLLQLLDKIPEIKYELN